MSYARLSDESDVRVYASAADLFTLAIRDRVPVETFESREALRDRLEALVREGLKVPDYCFARLDVEIATGKSIWELGRQAEFDTEDELIHG